MGDRLFWSERAQGNLDVFYENINQIHIYVEDTARSAKKFYTTLFAKVFAGKYRVEEVFLLGGKDKVLEHLQNRKSTGSRKSKCLYVVDSDLEMFNEHPNVLSDELLYVLPVCNVENLLIEEASIVKVVDNFSTTLTEEEIRRIFKEQQVFSKNEKNLIILFISFYLISKYNLNIPNVTLKIHPFVCDDDKSLVSRASVVEMLEKVNGVLMSKHLLSRREVYNEYKQVYKYLMDKKDVLLDFISGKDFLLPLAYHFVKMLADQNVSMEILKQQLVQYCTLEKIKDLRTKY